MIEIISIASHITASICKILTLDSRYFIRPRLIEILIDYKKWFLNLEIGWSNSIEDYWIFENFYLNDKYEKELAKLDMISLMIRENINEKILMFILRDSAYKNFHHIVMIYKIIEYNVDCFIHHLNFKFNKVYYQIKHVFDLLKGQFQIFKKFLRFVDEDLPFSIHLIISICIIHNFLINAWDTVPETDILQTVVEWNDEMMKDDIDDEEIRNVREQNYEKAI